MRVLSVGDSYSTAALPSADSLIRLVAGKPHSLQDSVRFMVFGFSGQFPTTSIRGIIHSAGFLSILHLSQSRESLRLPHRMDPVIVIALDGRGLSHNGVYASKAHGRFKASVPGQRYSLNIGHCVSKALRFITCEWKSDPWRGMDHC